MADNAHARRARRSLLSSRSILSRIWNKVTNRGITPALCRCACQETRPWPLVCTQILQEFLVTTDRKAPSSQVTRGRQLSMARRSAIFRKEVPCFPYRAASSCKTLSAFRSQPHHPNLHSTLPLVLCCVLRPFLPSFSFSYFDLVFV